MDAAGFRPGGGRPVRCGPRPVGGGGREAGEAAAERGRWQWRRQPDFSVGAPSGTPSGGRELAGGGPSARPPAGGVSSGYGWVSAGRPGCAACPGTRHRRLPGPDRGRRLRGSRSALPKATSSRTKATVKVVAVEAGGGLVQSLLEHGRRQLLRQLGPLLGGDRHPGELGVLQLVGEDHRHDGGTGRAGHLLDDVHQRGAPRDLVLAQRSGSAAVIIGIMVAPMPRPITNSVLSTYQ